MKKYFSIISVFIFLLSVNHAQITKKTSIKDLKPSKGVKHIAPPVFRFLFPKEGDVLQRGKKYTLSWKQIRQSSENLNYVKLKLINLRNRKEFLISQGTPNRRFFKFTMPVYAENGEYHFLIMPMNMSFVNQSPDFKIGAFDLICEVRSMARVYTWKNYIIIGKQNFYVEFEIWIINKGTGIFSKIPVVWRIIDKNSNRVIVQREAGFSNVFPNRYYSAKIKETFYKDVTAIFSMGKSKKYFDASKALIEVEIDPRHTLGESTEFRKNNIVRREVAYDMHIKGRK